MKKTYWKKTFWSVFASNLECAFCEEKKGCPWCYYPNHEIPNGTRNGRCKKDTEKYIKKSLKRKLP